MMHADKIADQIETVTETLATFHEPGDIIEVRAIAQGGGAHIGYFASIETAARAAVNHDREFAPERIQFTSNPVHPDCEARSAGKLSRLGKGGGTSDGDILNRRWMMIDFDPERKSGISSTDAELAAAMRAGHELAEHLREMHGWPEPIVCESGNGCHLHYRTDLPNDRDASDLVRRALKSLAAMFDETVADASAHPVKLDTETGKAAIMPRLYGLTARKGSSTPDRPHRVARIVFTPETVRVLDRSKLEHVAALLPSHNSNGATARQQPAQMMDRGRSGASWGPLDVGHWLTDHGIEFTTGATSDGRASWKLKQCPVCGKEVSGKTADVMQKPDGELSAKCMFESCPSKSGTAWHHFRDAIGKPERRHHPQAPAYEPRNGHSAPATQAPPRDDEPGKSLRDYGIEDGDETPQAPPPTETAQAPPETTATGRPVFKLDLIDSATFDAMDYRQRYLVKGVLAANQPGVVGGPQKSLKTSQVADLCLSLATGTPFLGAFEVPEAVSTLFLSGESGGYTLKETARRIMRSKGLNLADVQNCYWGFNLPQIGNMDHMEILAEAINARGIQVAVIDPMYLCLLSAGDGGRAANLFEMGNVLRELSRIGEETGCTMIAVHHLRKPQAMAHGRPNEFKVPELEDLAFAGFSEWARQWILIGRRERYQPGTGEHRLWMSAGGSAGHGGLWAVDIDEGTNDDPLIGRKWEVMVTTGIEVVQTAQQKREAEQKDKTARMMEERREKVLAVLRQHPDGITPRQLRLAAGLKPADCEAVTLVLAGEKVTEEVYLKQKNNKLEACIRLAPEAQRNSAELAAELDGFP